MDWFRWHHGTSKDPKWRVVARKSGAPLTAVLSVWATLNENASESTDRGTLQGWDPEDIAAQFDIEVGQVKAIFDAMQGKVLDGYRLTGWHKRNPKREREDDDSAGRVQQYRERLRKHGGTTGGYLKHQPVLMERDRGMCIYCGIKENLCIDHMVPVIQGGTDDPDNLAMACKACNSGKSGRTPEEASYEIIHLPAKEAYLRFLSRHVTPKSTKSPPEREKEREIYTPPTDVGEVSVYSPDFEIFWTAYPRKIGKGAAWKVWVKLKPSRRLQDLMLTAIGTARQSADWKRENGKYIPHPTTWLTQARWDDTVNDKKTNGLHGFL